MSSSSSYSESSRSSDDSDGNYYSESDYEREVESASSGSSDGEHEAPMANIVSDDENALCADDPVADAEWTAQYEKEMDEINEQERRLQDRLDGVVEVNQWCKCGNCMLESLQNISECYCCLELEGCKEAMESPNVLEDIPEGMSLTCITNHPGFNPVCLQKWSLRMASSKF